MRILIFLASMFIIFSLISSISYQSRSMTKPGLKKSELEKIDPDLRELKSLKSEEEVEVIVWLNDRESSESIKELGKVKYEYDIIPAVAMEVPVEELENLAKRSNVEKIVPDRVISAFRVESMSLIKASNASSSFGVNGTGVNVSILDTGIFNHSEFQSPNRIVKQKCYCNVDPGNCCPDETAENDNATDDSGHGTHCAGIAAGGGEGTMTGVAINASLFAVKVLNASGKGSDSDLIAGIDWAVNNGSNIISLSLGGIIPTGEDCYSYYSAPEAVDNATRQGVLVVVAAGNDGASGSETVSAPGCAKRAITVGNTNDGDSIVSSSSRGPTRDNRTKPDLTAPGNSINSTYLNDGYHQQGGTSMSTPHIAGVAALVMQKFNQVNSYYPKPDRVKAILMTAVNTTGQRNNTYGSGRIDAYEAVRIVNFTKNDTISTGQEHHYRVNVTSTDFKTTLYWPENRTTNNDLNLFVGNDTQNYSYPTDVNDSVEQVFFTDAATGYWNVYVVDVSGNNQDYYLVSNMNLTTDSTAPVLVLVNPQNTTQTSQNGILLNFTTDSTNHTIWYRLDEGNEVSITGNTTFNLNSDGLHNITLYVNDSWNNTNYSTQYFSVDTASPVITVISPTSNSVSNYSTTSIWFSISLNETGNVSLLSIDGSENSTMTKLNNTNFLNISTITEGNHNVTFYVNDSVDNKNTTRVNFTVSINPIIRNEAVDKSSVFMNESINISANISEDNINSVLVNITWPDGNNTQQNMTNTSSLYFYLFNDTNQTGAYNVIINVNDSMSNEANTSLTFEVGQSINVSSEITNGTTALNVTIKIYYNGTNQTRNQTTNTSLGFILPSGLWDFFVNTSQMNVTLFTANLTQNITRQINVTENVSGNFTANFYSIKTVALKFDNFTFNTANLTFDFNPSLVSNVTALQVYKCSNWNFATSNCSVSWTNDSADATFNATNTSNNVIVTSANFSAFSFGETQTTTTTTTPAATTTVSSSSSSSGGGTTTTTVPNTTSTSTTTTVITTTTPVVISDSIVATTISTEEQTTGVKTAWYLVLIPTFAVVVAIVWFLFLRKPGVDNFQRLKEKWSNRSS